MSSATANESGQVLVEYILMLSLALMIVGIIATGFKSSLRGFWHKIGCEVAAACPACPHPLSMGPVSCRR